MTVALSVVSVAPAESFIATNGLRWQWRTRCARRRLLGDIPELKLSRVPDVAARDGDAQRSAGARETLEFDPRPESFPFTAPTK